MTHTSVSYSHYLCPSLSMSLICTELEHTSQKTLIILIIVSSV